jgi:hypothetical protein
VPDHSPSSRQLTRPSRRFPKARLEALLADKEALKKVLLLSRRRR